MASKTPPFVTPFALVSIVLALGATNVVVNKTTHTNEGARVSTVSRRDSSTTSSEVHSSSSSENNDDNSESSSSSQRDNQQANNDQETNDTQESTKIGRAHV